jgi:hypothetical protein
MRRVKQDNSYILNYDLNDNYPLIPNQNTYFEQEKIVSINSGDRNIIKYPQSNSFEILLPTDIVNVSSIQLQTWMVPIETNTFSYKRNNLHLEFTLSPLLDSALSSKELFYPHETTIVNPAYIEIVNKVIAESKKFVIMINEGQYENYELVNEIQNKMNAIVDDAILDYMKKIGDFSDYIPYTFFKIIISKIDSKFWFINTLHPFDFTDSKLYKTDILIGEVFNPCSNDKLFSSYTYYGLPAYLGFKEVPVSSGICTNKYDVIITSNTYPSLPEPSFSQVIVDGKFANVNYLKPRYNYTLSLYTHIFLELETLSCGDETKPFSNNEFTRITNQGNGSVNSFLGKIPIFSTSSSLYATSNGGSEKQPISYFNPPLERLRKFKVNLRYHDGTNVDFGLYDWDFALKVTSYLPTQNKKITKTPF